MDEPLHVRVARALGWIECKRRDAYEWEGIAPDPLGREQARFGIWGPIVRYDTDWSATGPLIEKWGFAVWPQSDGWAAEFVLEDRAQGETPLIAVCRLILALKEAGKLAA